MTASPVTSPTCSDQNFHYLSYSLQNNNCFFFAGVAVAGATSYTCTWSGGFQRASMIVIQYSGGKALGNTTTSTGTSTTPTITLSGSKPNSWIIAVMGFTGGNISIAANVGNLRISQNGGTGSANSIALVDNTISSTGTCTLTTGSATYYNIALEFYLPVGANGLMLLGVGA